MTEPLFEDPADLTTPEARESYLEPVGLTPQEKQEAKLIQEQGSKAKTYAAAALALGAGFLWYRRAMKRRLEEKVTINMTTAALDAAAVQSWRSLSPMWIKMMTPTILESYIRGVRDVRRGAVATDLLEQAATEYAATLGHYINRTSSAALLEGFNAYANKQIPRRLAAIKAIEGFGLSSRQMRSLVYADDLKAKTLNTIIEHMPESKARRFIEDMLLDRSRSIGENEAYSAEKQAQQILWMYLQDKGRLPKSAYRMWVTARDEKVCATCGPLHKKTAGIKEPFHTDIGDVFMPALHPNCRCDVILRVPTSSLFKSLVRQDSEFEEEHPRGEGGRFTDKPDEPQPQRSRPREEPRRGMPTAERETDSRLQGLAAAMALQRAEELQRLREMPVEEKVSEEEAEISEVESLLENIQQKRLAEEQQRVEMDFGDLLDEPVGMTFEAPEMAFEETPGMVFEEEPGMVFEGEAGMTFPGIEPFDAASLEFARAAKLQREQAERARREALEAWERELKESTVRDVAPDENPLYIYAGRAGIVPKVVNQEIQILPHSPILEFEDQMRDDAMQMWAAHVAEVAPEKDRRVRFNMTSSRWVGGSPRVPITFTLTDQQISDALDAEAMDSAEELVINDATYPYSGEPVGDEIEIPLAEIGAQLGASRHQDKPVYYALSKIHHEEFDKIVVDDNGYRRFETSRPFLVSKVEDKFTSAGHPILVVHIVPHTPAGPSPEAPND